MTFHGIHVAFFGQTRPVSLTISRPKVGPSLEPVILRLRWLSPNGPKCCLETFSFPGPMFGMWSRPVKNPDYSGVLLTAPWWSTFGIVSFPPQSSSIVQCVIPQPPSESFTVSRSVWSLKGFGRYLFSCYIF
jgi:hypothetical protein